jgi:hypothetical protein
VTDYILQGARPYTIEEYRKIGRKRFKEIFGDVKDPGEKEIEAEFWHKASSNRFSVQYGSDVDGTAVGFVPSYNIPRRRDGSLLNFSLSSPQTRGECTRV